MRRDDNIRFVNRNAEVISYFIFFLAEHIGVRVLLLCELVELYKVSHGEV